MQHAQYVVANEILWYWTSRWAQPNHPALSNVMHFPLTYLIISALSITFSSFWYQLSSVQLEHYWSALTTQLLMNPIALRPMPFICAYGRKVSSVAKTEEINGESWWIREFAKVTAAGLIQFQQEMSSNSKNKDSMSARWCEIFKLMQQACTRSQWKSQQRSFDAVQHIQDPNAQCNFSFKASQHLADIARYFRYITSFWDSRVDTADPCTK